MTWKNLYNFPITKCRKARYFLHSPWCCWRDEKCGWINLLQVNQKILVSHTLSPITNCPCNVICSFNANRICSARSHVIPIISTTITRVVRLNTWQVVWCHHFHPRAVANRQDPSDSAVSPKHLDSPSDHPNSRQFRSFSFPRRDVIPVKCNDRRSFSFEIWTAPKLFAPFCSPSHRSKQSTNYSSMFGI